MRQAGFRASRTAALAAAILTVGASAAAWWHVTHSIIDEAAFILLPKDMPRFFRKSSQTVISYSKDPDILRNEALPALTSTERPDHFFDLELVEDLDLPGTRAEFIALCHENGLNPAVVGTLPYSITEWSERLVLAFAEHRRKPRDQAIQAKILYIAGILSHYTADAAQPLHCTVHFDGRMNDDGTSPKSGIHAKMDALPASSGVSPHEAVKDVNLKPTEDVLGSALKVIRAANALVDKVYELDALLPAADESKPVKVDPRVRMFALECARRAAEFTAIVWYSAWLKSAIVVLPEWYR